MIKESNLKLDKVKGFSVDSLARSLYVTFSHKPVAKTVRKTETMAIDYDKNGKIVGIEYIRLKSAQINLAVKKAVKDIKSVLPTKLGEPVTS